MDSFEKIKIALPVLLEKLNVACTNQGVEVHELEKKSDNLYHFKFGSDGLIGIFITKKGLTIQYKLGKMPEQGKLLLDEVFSEQNGEIQKIAGTYALYEGILRKYKSAEQFKDALIQYAKELGANIEDKNKSNYEIFSGDIIRNHEKITIHIYKTKVLLQGKNHFLWDEICTWIEKDLESPISEILVRVTGDKDIFGKITDSKGKGVIEEAEALLKARIKDAYDFLFEHDKKFLNSAICLILYDNGLPEYSCIAMGAYKGFEGYFRKAIVEVIGTRVPDVIAKVYDPKETLGWLFEPNITGTYSLKPKFVDSSNSSINRAFERLYRIYKDERNPYCHSTGTATKTVDTMEEAKDLVDGIISSIGQTFVIF